MPDVFLSYSREDQVFARRFAGGFEREGLSVWWDQSLNPGEAFDQVTERALDEASAVIVLWSKSSVNSRWVRAEATQANSNQRLVPVMIEPCKRPIMFELTHTADLSGWQGNTDDPDWQSFLASVRQFVQRAGPITGTPLVSTREVRGAPPVRRKFATLTHALAVRKRVLTGWLAVGLAFTLIGAGIAGSLALSVQSDAPQGITRFTMELPEPIGDAEALALSPDGRRIVYAIGRQLYSRRLDQDEPTPLPDTNGAQNPFFSPDGKSVAFFTATQLKAFEFEGEASRVIADVKGAAGLVGGWDEEGRIFFGQGGSFGLSMVPAVGGEPELFAKLGDYADLDYPDVLPGGEWVLFTACIKQGDWSGAEIVAQNVATGERRIVLKGGHFARYLSTGHLVFARGGTLFAVPFDKRRVELRGRPVPVVQGVTTSEQSGHAVYAVSTSGTLIYTPGAPGGNADAPATIARVSRGGELTPMSVELRDYSNPRVSPDGSRIAVEVAGVPRGSHIWVMVTATGAATQLTFDGEENRFPVWSADGREVLFTSKRGEDFSIYRKAADGSGEARRVLDGSSDLAPTDLRGNTLLFQDKGKDGARDIFTIDLDSNGPPQALLATTSDESAARVSPDGAWVVYISVVLPGSLRPEARIFVRPFSNAATGGQRAISNGGGISPVWSRTGDEIIYVKFEGVPGPLVSVPLAVTPTTITPTGRHDLFAFGTRFDITAPGTLHATPFDVLPEGRFIVIDRTSLNPMNGTEGSASRQRINVVLNWIEDLRRLVPAE